MNDPFSRQYFLLLLRRYYNYRNTYRNLHIFVFFVGFFVHAIFLRISSLLQPLYVHLKDLNQLQIHYQNVCMICVLCIIVYNGGRIVYVIQFSTTSKKCHVVKNLWLTVFCYYAYTERYKTALSILAHKHFMSMLFNVR